jgi:prophage antirepressor-like protein
MKTEEKNLPVIIPFQYEAREVRVVQDQDGTPWWVVKDICDVLEHSDPSMAVRGLDEDEKGTRKVCTPGGDTSVLVISESGLYTLIIRSNKPQAKPFRKWVTAEVLPAIRKTGCYRTNQKADIEKTPHDYRNKKPSLQTVLNTAQRDFLLWKSVGFSNKQAVTLANKGCFEAYGVDIYDWHKITEEDIPDIGGKEKVVREKIAAVRNEESDALADELFEGLRTLTKAERDKCIEVREGQLNLRLPVAKKMLEKRGRYFVNERLMDSLKEHPAFLGSRVSYRGHFGANASTAVKVWRFEASVLDAVEAPAEGGRS